MGIIDNNTPTRYNWPMNFFEAFGSWLLQIIDNFLNFCAYNLLIARTLLGTRPKGQRASLRVLFKQVLFTGYDALPVVAFIALAIGAISIIQSLNYLPIFGAEGFLGDILVTVIIRELGPLITAFFVIGRSGTAITTEIGNMVVNHEVEALESMGVDPIRYLVLPRMFGFAAALVSLNVYFDIFAILGGFLVAKFVVVTSLATFLAQIRATMILSDVLISLFKGVLFGSLIALICTFRGFSVETSTTEVPQQTTKAVLNAVSALFLADGIIAVIYYF
jgi:phospholipid/cholesterol/gamma-HCH transport system permease protein